MKISKYIRKYLWLSAAVVAAGCSSDEDLLINPDEYEGEIPEEVTLTLSIPDETVVELGTRAAAETLSSITVFCFDKDGKHLSHQSYTSGWDSGNGGYSITVPIHSKTRSVQLVTNASVSATQNDPSAIWTTDASAGVMWGKADIKDIITVGSTVTMLRQNAKVSVTSAPGGFLQGIGVYGTSKSGSLAPASTNVTFSSSGNPTISSPTYVNDATEFTYDSGLKGSGDEVAIFETPADVRNNDGTFKTYGRVIIAGKYEGATYYYPVAFRTRQGSGVSEVEGNYSYTPIPVLRNHHYKLTVTEVRGKGWTSYAEACKAEPDNRLTVLITVESEDITDIAANRDYMLGIGGDIEVEYNHNATVSVLTTCPDANIKPVFSVGTDAPWVKTSQAQPGTPTTVNNLTGGINKSGRKYSVTLPLDANNASSLDRSATVTVRVGELTRTFTLTQKGRDYLRDPQRKITLEGLGTTISDYMDWVDNTCQGLKAEQNRGVERDNGLHFPVVPAYTLTYKIPVLNGDKSYRATGNFSATKSGNYYVVTATNASTKSITTGTFTIVDAYNATIEYKLYRTGYFHELKSNTASLQSETETLRRYGWYYYEVVKIGEDWVLDRNLGAPTNQPYISTYAGFKDQKDAIGGYFKVSTSKSSSESNPQTIASSLGVSKFVIPTRDQVKNWNVYVANASGTSSEYAKVAQARTTGSQVAENTIYFPHGGYYEGESPKYETHANIWTRTLLAGNQGFANTSPEFGYWYLYLDCYGNKVTFSNMRFFRGTAGQAPDANSVYKYMPIRLVWKD